MSDTALIVLVTTGSALVYCMLVGVTWALMPAKWRESDDPEIIVALLGALAWPAILPMFLGVKIVRWLSTPGTALPRAEVHRR